MQKFHSFILYLIGFVADCIISIFLSQFTNRIFEKVNFAAVYIQLIFIFIGIYNLLVSYQCPQCPNVRELTQDNLF